MPNHIEEQTLEVYARGPEALETAVRQDLAKHLEACSACRSIAGFLRAFYAELNGCNDEVLPQVDKFVNTLFPQARIIPLLPFRSKPDPVYTSDDYTIVLAAMSPKPPAPRFQTVATLASAQRDTLLRILRDNEADSFRLYVLSDDPRQRQNTVVSFPELGLAIVTDEKGQAMFQLSGQAAPENWDTLTCLLRLPLGEVDVSAAQLLSNPVVVEETALPDHKMKVSYTAGALMLETTSQRSGTPESTLAILASATEGTFFINLHNGKGNLRLEPLPNTFVIRLYY